MLTCDTTFNNCVCCYVLELYIAHHMAYYKWSPKCFELELGKIIKLMFIYEYIRIMTKRCLYVDKFLCLKTAIFHLKKCQE